MTLKQTTLWDDRHHAALTARSEAQRERYRRRSDGRGRHSNSLAASEQMGSVITARRAAITAWLRDHGPATDRQVRDALFGPGADMNMVRPRITELLDAGALRECGSVECEITGRKVRLVTVTGGNYERE